MKNKVFGVVLSFILLVGFFLRFYKLGEVPNGLYQDETAIGYNAYSIIMTGKDEYGESFPLYFKSFGDYKLPVYIYLDTIPIYFLGLTPFAVRFPSAFFGFLTLPLFFFLVKELSKNKYLALVATGLLAINPWHLHYNRATFEVSISLFLFVLGYLFLSIYFLKQKRGYFFLGTLCFIISLYSYNLTRILAPLIYILIIFAHSNIKKTVRKKEIVISFVSSIVLLLPFVFTFFQKEGIHSASGTLIFSSAVVRAPLLEMRSYFIGAPIFAKLFFNTSILTFWQFVKNVLSYFSVNFFFISGSPHGNHGIGTVGLFYLFEFPLIFMGILLSIQKKSKWIYIFLWWVVVAILVASLTRDVPHATRSFFLIVPLEIFSAVGLIEMFSWIKNQKNKTLKYVTICIVSLLVFYNVVYYFASYYVRFPVEYAKEWREQDKSLSLFLKEEESKYSKIIIDKNAGFIYSSLLFYGKHDPSNFQNTVVRLPDDSEGFSNVLSFGKYEIRDIDWSKDLNRKNVLLITSNDRKPKQLSSNKMFMYPTRPVVISLKQEILQFPVQDVAYVAVSSK